MNSAPAILDCNDLPIFSCGYTYISTANSPGQAYIVTTLGANEFYKIQIAIDTNSADLKTRGCVEGKWSNWVTKS